MFFVEGGGGVSFSIYIDPFKAEFGSCIKIEVGLVREEFLDNGPCRVGFRFCVEGEGGVP